MAINEVVKNYTLGRGKLNFGQFRPGTQIPRGERYLGNSPSLNFSATQETLDHYYSDGGINMKDASIILSQDYTGSFELDDINMANLAMFFLGEASTLTVAGSTVTGEQINDVEPGLSYQLGVSNSDPAGVRNVDAVVVTKVATPDPISLVAGTDYVLDAVLGRITLLEGGAVEVGDDLLVDYTVDASTRDRVITKGTAIEGSLRYISDNPAGKNIDYFMPYVKITPNGDFTLKGDEWQVIPFTIEILQKGDLQAIYADGRPYTP